MDPVTHALIGASASASTADENKLRATALIGATSAALPDLDVLIDSASDPLLQLEYHRTITHSLAFIPFGALLVSGIFWWFLKKKFTFKEIYFYSLIGISTAGIADTFTSYGVQLLWPFITTRFSWNLISVFDPLFSLGLVITLGWALIKHKKLAINLGLGWIALYLAFASIQQQRAQKIAHKLSTKRNHKLEKLIIKPTIANELLWSIRYVSGDTLFADGVWLFPFVDSEIYKGSSAKVVNWQQKYASYRGTTLYRDIRRFHKLSDGILITHPDTSRILGDGRYAMLPTSIKPLWGIQVDTTQPDQHVEFRTFRNTSANVRNRFLDMLLGR